MSQPPYGIQPPYGGQPPYEGRPNPGGSQSGWGQANPAGQPGFGQPPAGPQPGYGQPPTGSRPGYGQPQTGAQPSYGQPHPAASPGYVQPTQQFGQPAPGGYGFPSGGQPPYGGGPGAPYGSPPPSNKSPLPFIIIGLVVLLIAGGVSLFFALKNDEATPIANPTTTQTTESTADTADPTDDTDTTTEDTDTDSPGGDEPNFAESEDVAIAFVQLMSDGDYAAALATLCEDGRDASDGDGFADPQALADDFFLELGATTVTGGDATAVVPSDIDRDVVSFDLDTDVGVVSLDVQVLEEEVGADLTICGYDTV